MKVGEGRIGVAKMLDRDVEYCMNKKRARNCAGRFFFNTSIAILRIFFFLLYFLVVFLHIYISYVLPFSC